MADLVGIAEIADRAHVKPNTVSVWRKRHAATFPRPAAELAVGPVWEWRDVEAWLASPRLVGRPRTPA